jgi:hypothetical protein
MFYNIGPRPHPIPLLIINYINYLISKYKRLFLITTACIRHQCRKTTVFSSHGYLINTGVEKMNNILM